MRAFIDAEVTKDELLESLAWHRDEDRISQNWFYWQDGRGCAVGCTLRNFAPGREDDHALYEELFGIPRGLAHLEDAIFEGMAAALAREWPMGFIRSIPEGADLEHAADKLAFWLLGGKDSPLARWRHREYLQPTLELYRQHLDGNPGRRCDWKQAARAARTEAKSKDGLVDGDAAWAATLGHREGGYWTLAIEATGIAARLAEESRPKGTSAESARPARERARTEAWGRISDKLIEILEGTEADTEAVVQPTGR